MNFARLISSSILLALAAHGALIAFAADNDVAPKALALLEQHCLECHGGKATRSSFDLSTRERLLKGGDSGETAVVPGKPDQSVLLKKIMHTHEPAMPYKRDKLAEADIGLLRDWIAGGASYPRELKTDKAETAWSLKPLHRPRLPYIKNQSWTRTPVDRFIMAKLEENRLKPSAPADKRTLLRRVTYDLTGLPPTPEEMQNFLRDSSPGAFAKVIDRLLASPRYGERWARHWLDVVHYGDSHGHDQDRPRPNAWPYRDYVIQSFNSDKPYARFVEEQLAGDVLFPDDPNGIVATGFIAAGPWDVSSLMEIMEDTVDKKIARYLDRDDMVTTTMSTFVSSTVHCARCHNHKFDPIPQADYYNLQAVFAGVDRADRPFDPDPKVNAERQTLLKMKTALDVKDEQFIELLLSSQIQREVAAWEQSVLKDDMWTVLDPVTFTSANGATLSKQPDLSILSSGNKPEKDTYTIVANTSLTNITAVRLEVLTDSTHPRNGPGRQDNGNLHLSEFTVKAGPQNGGNATELALQNPTADFNQQDWGIEKSIDRVTNTAWGIFPEVGKPHFAVFELKENLHHAAGTTLTFVLDQLPFRRCRLP